MFYAQTAVKWNEKQNKATMRSRKVSAFWCHTRIPAGSPTLLSLPNEESLANAARACKANHVSIPIGITWAATPRLHQPFIKGSNESPNLTGTEDLTEYEKQACQPRAKIPQGVSESSEINVKMLLFSDEMKRIWIINQRWRSWKWVFIDT